MKAYLAGKMSGEPEHGFPVFREAAATLRAAGHEITSPVEMDESEGFDAATAPDVAPGSTEWAVFLARDVAVVADPAIEAVVVLPGWERSRGAALEVHVARELGKRVLAYPTLTEVKSPTRYQPPTTETVLEEAERLVGGDRSNAYGHPRDDFARTAGAWGALFGWAVSPAQVALAMIVVKLSRLEQTPGKRDSVTDICGYARAYEAVLAREGVPDFQDLQ